MATILYYSSYGSDDPTRATLPFVAALGALDEEQKAQIVLMGVANYLMKDYIADQVHWVGWPPRKEPSEKTVAQGVPFHV